MKQQIDYLAILGLFLHEEGWFRPWMEKPFRIENKVYATNAFAMAIIDATLVPDVQKLEDYDPKNVLSVIPLYNSTALGVVPVDELKSALTKIPLVDSEVECKCCQGEGEVEYEFDYNGRNYTTDAECPICAGEGVVKSKSGEKELDASATIAIGISNFKGFLIDKVVKACDIAGATEVEVLSQKTSKGSNIFAFNDVVLLVMPACLEPGQEETIVHTIKLK